MTTYTIEDYIAIAELDLLEAGGVDNWIWYSDALEDFEEFEDPAENAHELLRCLGNAGVDNWEWFGESITGLDDYEDYVRESFESGSQAEILNVHAWLHEQEVTKAAIPDPVVVEAPPVVEPFALKDAAERMVFEALVAYLPECDEDEIEAIVEDFRTSGFWKRNTFPKLMTRAFEETPPQDELPASYKNPDTYFNRARETYVVLVLGSRAFPKFLKNYMKARAESA